jgi:hypothetical protein
MPDEFYGANYDSGDEAFWEDSSGPYVIVQVHESDIWPVADNSESGTKDAIGSGLHPVIAIGGRTQADCRALNLTGVVTSFTAGLTTATGLVRVNIADGVIVRNWVANVTEYSGTSANAFEQAPVPGQCVYVDDSQALGEGVTLSLSPLNEDDLPNPLAGWLWYCEDEYADSSVGGPNESATFDGTLANSLVQQAYCVLLSNATALNQAQEEPQEQL